MTVSLNTQGRCESFTHFPGIIAFFHRDSKLVYILQGLNISCQIEPTRH